jgi:hypothetical protein
VVQDARLLPFVDAAPPSLAQEKGQVWRGLASFYDLYVPRPQRPVAGRSLRPRPVVPPSQGFFNSWKHRLIAQQRAWDELVDFLRGGKGDSLSGFRALVRRFEKEEPVDVNFTGPQARASILNIAAGCKRSRIVRHLVRDLKADIKHRTADCATPLMWAVLRCDAACVKAILEHPDCTLDYLDAKACPKLKRSVCGGSLLLR